MTKQQSKNKITLKRFMFAPTWSLLDVLAYWVLIRSHDWFSPFWGFTIGYLIFVYWVVFANTVREWGDK